LLAVSDHYTMGTTALSGNTTSFKLARAPVEPKPNACAANGWSVRVISCRSSTELASSAS
jgi:hypothetical protein